MTMCRPGQVKSCPGGGQEIIIAPQLHAPDVLGCEVILYAQGESQLTKFN